MREFVDREEELALLEEVYQRPGKKLVVVYGRRRVGKTELLKKFTQDKPHIYFLAHRLDYRGNVEDFATVVADYFNDIPPAATTFADVFKYLVRRIQDAPFVIVVDEFPYLFQRSPEVLAEFQYIYDEILEGTNTTLVLCGSSMGMIIKKVLSTQSPLYGRRTATLEVRPFQFKAVAEMTGLPVEEAIKVYSVFGNLPHYLSFYDGERDLLSNIREVILTKGAPLYREPEFYLLEEVREPAIYEKILRVTWRPIRPSRISSETGIPLHKLVPYIETLLELGLLRKETPLLERKRRSLYITSDPLFRFWYAAADRYLSLLEAGKQDYVVERVVKPRLPELFSLGFEEVVRDLLREKYPVVGRWWGKIGREVREVDVVAVNDGVLLGEVKWRENVDPLPVVRKLREVANHLGVSDARFLVVAKNFSRKVEGVELWDLRTISRLVSRQ